MIVKLIATCAIFLALGFGYMPHGRYHLPVKGDPIAQTHRVKNCAWYKCYVTNPPKCKPGHVCSF